MENMIKRVATVYGISEGEVELEIYRMIGEQIRTGTEASKSMWQTFICLQNIRTTQELVEKLFEAMMRLGVRSVHGAADAEHVVSEMVEMIKEGNETEDERQAVKQEMESDENIRNMFAVCCGMTGNL